MVGCFRCSRFKSFFLKSETFGNPVAIALDIDVTGIHLRSIWSFWRWLPRHLNISSVAAIWNQSLSWQVLFKTAYGWSVCSGSVCDLFFPSAHVHADSYKPQPWGLGFHSHKSGTISMHHKAMDSCFSF